jgi:hypothetical protein
VVVSVPHHFVIYGVSENRTTEDRGGGGGGCRPCDPCNTNEQSRAEIDGRFVVLCCVVLCCFVLCCVVSLSLSWSNERTKGRVESSSILLTGAEIDNHPLRTMSL